MTIGRIPSVEGGIQPTIVDAKGDLIAATAADTVNRLAVGSNDQVLVADSSTSTGLAWKSYGAQFVAGKNKIINGDFGINQRGFTSVTADQTFTFDRWVQAVGGSGTLTTTPQTFTPGTAPVAGYEGKNFVQCITASTSGTSEYKIYVQRIEDVRTFANQTVTVSFWAKAGSGTPKVAVELFQDFNSASSGVPTYAGQVTLSTSWARYSVNVTVPSISGKTIGASSYLALQLWLSGGSDFNSRTGSLGNQNATFQIWGVQVEAGSVATPFTTATGTLQGELAACQRYYWRQTATGASNVISVSNSAYANNGIVAVWPNPVPMRVKASSVDSSSVEVTDWVTATASNSITVDANSTTNFSVAIVGVAGTPLTQYRPYTLRASTSTGYIGFSAEL